MAPVGGPAPAACPVCGGELVVTRYTCDGSATATGCGTEVSGRFDAPPTGPVLDQPALDLVRVLVECRDDLTAVAGRLRIGLAELDDRLAALGRHLGTEPGDDAGGGDTAADEGRPGDFAVPSDDADDRGASPGLGVGGEPRVGSEGDEAEAPFVPARAAAGAAAEGPSRRRHDRRRSDLGRSTPSLGTHGHEARAAAPTMSTQGDDEPVRVGDDARRIGGEHDLLLSIAHELAALDDPAPHARS